MGNKTVAVIGAVNMDICGRPDKAPRMKDSNPGTVSFSPGGVGRNIAHNLCLLDIDVKFIAAIGDDVYGDSVYESCVRLGMDMHLSRRMSGGRTSSYLYVTDENGDMLVGVSDTDISASITPEYLKAHIKEINAADAVVIDANLTRETVAWIAENVTAPLYADPVSAAKAERLRPALSKLTAFKPNEFEAKSMTNETTSLFAAEALLREGVKKRRYRRGGGQRDNKASLRNDRDRKLHRLRRRGNGCDNLGRCQRSRHSRKRVGRNEGRRHVRRLFRNHKLRALPGAYKLKKICTISVQIFYVNHTIRQTLQDKQCKLYIPHTTVYRRYTYASDKAAPRNAAGRRDLAAGGRA